MKRFICVLLVFAHLSACTTLTTVPYGGGASGKGQASSIAPGDQLRITFREGGEKRIKVTSFSADEICAADGCIRATDVASVERAESNDGGVLLAVAAVLAIALVLASMGVGGGIGAAMVR